MGLPEFVVHDISNEFSSGALEYLGGKRKGWFTFNNERFLFKQGRPGTGENWAEKVTSELAKFLNLPHASYELAYVGNEQCVISPNFLKESEELKLGNQLIEGFDANRKFKNINHTLKAILDSLRRYDVQIPSGIMQEKCVMDVKDLFIGYMCFDAWIGNSDRHAENWGIITKVECPNVLAPTFDHASSLGRNESDERRNERLQTRDAGFSVETYVKRAETPIYDEEGRKLRMLGLVNDCKKYAKDATGYWIEKIFNLMEQRSKVREVFDRVPNSFITEPARNFAMAMLEKSLERLRT